MASPMTTGRFTTASVVRIAACGWLMMGCDAIEPSAPVLFRVKVPPCTSSTASLPCRARGSQVRGAHRDARDAERVGVAQHGHDKSVRSGNRYAYVECAFFRIMASSAQDELSRGFSRSDSATAFITKCKYVRLTPSRRWKSSLSASRRRTSPLTSTSVIDHAAGISDALRFIFAAIIRRTGDSGRRSSSALTDMAETAGAEAAGASRTVDCARASVYASTSCA